MRLPLLPSMECLCRYCAHARAGCRAVCRSIVAFIIGRTAASTDVEHDDRQPTTAINCLLDLAAAVCPAALQRIVIWCLAGVLQHPSRLQANPPRTWASTARNKSGCSILRVRSIRLICDLESLCNIHSARRYRHKQSSSGVPQFHKSNSTIVAESRWLPCACL